MVSIVFPSVALPFKRNDRFDDRESESRFFGIIHYAFDPSAPTSNRILDFRDKMVKFGCFGGDDSWEDEEDPKVGGRDAVFHHLNAWEFQVKLMPSQK